MDGSLRPDVSLRPAFVTIPVLLAAPKESGAEKAPQYSLPTADRV